MTPGTRLWTRLALSLFVCGGIAFGIVTAHSDDDAKKKSQPVAIDFKLPAAFTKVAPENIEELRDIEKHVQKVIAKVMPAVVGVKVGPGQGSGVIISEDGLVLTAGHVSGAPKKNATIVMLDGTELKGKTLGQNTGIDSGMVKISAVGAVSSEGSPITCMVAGVSLLPAMITAISLICSG